MSASRKQYIVLFFLFFLEGISYSMEIVENEVGEKNFDKKDNEIKDEKVCFEIQSLNSVKRNRILHNNFWKEKVGENNYWITLIKQEPGYSAETEDVKENKGLFSELGFDDEELFNCIKSLGEEAKINTYLVEVKKSILDKIETERGFEYMFAACPSLIKIKGVENIINGRGIKSLKGMFNYCVSLKTIESDEVWDLSNVENFSKVFYFCESLIDLPNNMENWDIKNCLNIEDLFYCCKRLKKIPDISKWSVDKVENMNGLFGGCCNLSSLPDISKWNTKNLKEIPLMFYDCGNLKDLPDISKWNTENVVSMEGLFKHCNLLEYLPDISLWNTSNVSSMREMFYCCKNLKELPDISKWNTEKLNRLDFMFYLCENLVSLPDISVWNGQNIEIIDGLFNGCKRISTLPNISKWKNLKNISFNSLINNCLSLSHVPGLSKLYEINNRTSTSLCGCANLACLPDYNISQVEGNINMLN